jgi:hypothetical protein
VGLGTKEGRVDAGKEKEQQPHAKEFHSQGAARSSHLVHCVLPPEMVESD